LYTLKKRKPLKILTLGFSSIIIGSALIFTACATGSKSYNAALDELDEFAPLDAGGIVYLYIDAVKARPILDAVELPGMGSMDKKQRDQVFDRTSSAVAAYYPETGDRRFLVAAQGAYPSARANMSFGFSSAWKKRRSQTGDAYWYSVQNKLSVSLSPSRAFISDGDPFVQPSGTQSPEGLAPFRQEAVLAGWVDNGAAPINRFLAGLNIPIEIPAGRVLFGVYQREQGYEARIRIETPSASQARGVAAIISMARLFMPPPASADDSLTDPLALAGVLFANPPKQEGVYLDVHTGPLNKKGISLLFNMFSVYSK
jgi:hypothetical protein